MDKERVIVPAGLWIAELSENRAREIEQRWPGVGVDRVEWLLERFQFNRALLAEMPKPSDAIRELTGYRKKISHFLDAAKEMQKSRLWGWAEKRIAPFEYQRLSKIVDKLTPIHEQLAEVIDSIEGGRAPSAIDILIQNASVILQNVGEEISASENGALFQITQIVLESAHEKHSDLARTIRDFLAKEQK